MNNNMKLEFLSLSENERFARYVASAFVAQLNPTLEQIEDIKAAVSEAVTNVVVHAYPDSVGTIYMSCDLSDDLVKIKIRDKGCGIENIALARRPLYTGQMDSERSGLGFTVMETFMDEIAVESKKGVGTTVTLIKRISGKPYKE